MIRGIVNELRQLAQKCTKLFRAVARPILSPTNLEALGVDLMAKAHELEQKYDQ